MEPPPPQKPYWPPFSVCGKEVSLAHLEPFEFQCQTPDGNLRRIRVRFSPHVFSRKYEDGEPHEGMCFDDRIFCPDRYEDSHLLKDIITGLPGVRVYQTWERRNYVFLAVETPQRDDRHHLFFRSGRLAANVIDMSRCGLRAPTGKRTPVMLHRTGQTQYASSS